MDCSNAIYEPQESIGIPRDTISEFKSHLLTRNLATILLHHLQYTLEEQTQPSKGT